MMKDKSGKYRALLALSIRQQYLEKRIYFILLLMLAPPLVSLFWALSSADHGTPFVFITEMVVSFYLSFLLLVLGLVSAVPVIHSEIDDGTAKYLVSRPVSRFYLVLVKYLGYFIVNAILVTASLSLLYVIVMLILAPTDILSYLLPLAEAVFVSVLAVALFGAFFLLLGVLFKRPVVIGLLVGFFWEVTISLLPTHLSKLTMSYYLRSLLANLVENASTRGMMTTDLWKSLLVIIVLTLFFLALAGMAFRRKDIN